MREVLLVGIGGGAGSILRYAVGLAVTRAGISGSHWSTLTVNVAGSLLLGFIARWFAAPNESPTLWLLLAVGVCGGFTTFSAYALDIVSMIQRGATTAAVLYGATS